MELQGWNLNVEVSVLGFRIWVYRLAKTRFAMYVYLVSVKSKRVFGSKQAWNFERANKTAAVSNNAWPQAACPRSRPQLRGQMALALHHAVDVKVSMKRSTKLHPVFIA